VVWSFVYLAVRRLLALAVLIGRSDRSKELEILVLRHELAILRRRSGRSRLEPADRALLAALSQVLPRRVWQTFSVKPETLLRWHVSWWRGAGRTRTERQDGRRLPGHGAS
jgi:putative transposase